jgi:outer membrane protein OmpA-like peptidoglycan-associated protein
VPGEAAALAAPASDVVFPDILEIAMPVRSARALLALAAVTVCVLGAPAPASAQFGKLKNKVKEKIDQRVDQKTDEAATKAVDAADPTAAKPASSTAGSAPAAASGAATQPASGADAPAAATVAVGKGEWANYDFRPGDKPLFVDDFAADEIGDFPRRLELKGGNMELVEWQGHRLLRASSYGGFYIPLPETLPERFTIEFDFAGPDGWMQDVNMDGKEAATHSYVSFRPSGGGIEGGPVKAASEPSHPLYNTLFPVRIMVDGKYAKVYMDDKRVANVPNAEIVRANKILVSVRASEKTPAYFGNIRVMAGGNKLYDALASAGRVATQGIYFDTGSDRIRGESSATLKEIGTMLQEHPDLKLTIEGHTDNVGAAAANQTLSEKRAAAVRQYLVDSYGIGAERLSAKGYGAAKPVAPNTTPEGRQQNRRVELVKM